MDGIVCIGVSTPLFLAKPPYKSANSPSPPPLPLLDSLLPLYWFFVNPPLKVGFLKFFILNTILSFKSN